MLYIQNSSSEKTIKLVLEMILADNGLLFFVVLSSKMSKNATNCQCIQIYSNVCMMYDD